jgi:anti-sigma regulatory factor (Ser/Thr protein kinase)
VQVALPSVAMLLCAGVDTLAAPLARTSVGTVPVFDSVTAARAAVAAHTQGHGRLRIMLDPSPDAPGTARDQVAAACAAWGASSVVNGARLIVSELVTNAMVHAGTQIEVDFMLRHPFLHLRVRDASVQTPLMGRKLDADRSGQLGGRGLRLVDRYSSAWGYLLGAGGKVVWATLRTRPVGT